MTHLLVYIIQIWKKTEAEQIPDNEGTNVDLFRTQKWKWIFFRSCKNELIKLLQSENSQPFSVYFHYKLNIFGLWMKQDNRRPNLWDIKKFYKLNSLSGYYKELKLFSDFKMAASFCLFIQHRDSGRWTLSVCSVRLLVVVCFCFLFQLRTLCGSLLTEHKLSSLTLSLRMLGGAGVLLMDSSLRVWLLKCSPLKLKVPKH